MVNLLVSDLSAVDVPGAVVECIMVLTLTFYALPLKTFP